jgi:hypothetical protein
VRDAAAVAQFRSHQPVCCSLAPLTVLPVLLRPAMPAQAGSLLCC